jgi:molybdopterin converting factor small subunit
MVTVYIPPLLRDLTGGVAQCQLAAGSVRQIVAQLEERYPGMLERLCERDALRPGLAVSINGTVSRAGMAGKVPEDAELHFLPAIGGG